MPLALQALWCAVMIAAAEAPRNIPPQCVRVAGSGDAASRLMQMGSCSVGSCMLRRCGDLVFPESGRERICPLFGPSPGAGDAAPLGGRPLGSHRVSPSCQEEGGVGAPHPAPREPRASWGDRPAVECVTGSDTPCRQGRSVRSHFGSSRQLSWSGHLPACEPIAKDLVKWHVRVPAPSSPLQRGRRRRR